MRYKDNLNQFKISPTSFLYPGPPMSGCYLLKSQEARTFYETEALRSGWSVRQLNRQIGSQFYERLALSKNKAAMLGKAENSEPRDLVTPEETIKDPFVLEFLDLKDEYSESDFEEALIQHLMDFLLELGDDFAFLGGQRRLRIDDTWFRIDLVFFHRRLRCLVIIDLKVGKFSYADAGQMHLYLNYASEHWMKPGENPPVGLILCAEKGSIRGPLRTRQSPNKVLAAEYQTVLPDERLGRRMVVIGLALAAGFAHGQQGGATNAPAINDKDMNVVQWEELKYPHIAQYAPFESESAEVVRVTLDDKGNA